MKKTIIITITIILTMEILTLLFFNQDNQNLEYMFQNAFPEKSSPNGKIIEYPITAEQTPINLPQGRIINSWTYNKTTPGPEIRISLGDTLRIPFTNKLPQETTIHFHGIRVPNLMDGVPEITQNPIPPNHSFIYEFTPKDPGTFWFHPHIRGSEQLEKGLYGTIIVEDTYSKSINQDKVIILDDWRLSNNQTIDEQFNTPHDVSHDGRWGEITVNNKTIEIIPVLQGESVRLRIINTANGRVFKPIFSKKVMLVAVDGMYLEKPTIYTPMDLAPGNRIDIEFIATEKNIKMYDTFLQTPHLLANIHPIGISTTQTKTQQYPKTKIPKINHQNIAKITPLLEYTLDAYQGSDKSTSRFWSINKKIYGQDTPYTLPHNKVSKIRFKNTSARLHPMHLHGQFFMTTSINGKPANEPFWRDTVLLKRNEYIDALIMPKDKGIWAMHCHIQEHAETGMMTTVIVE